MTIKDKSVTCSLAVLMLMLASCGDRSTGVDPYSLLPDPQRIYNDIAVLASAGYTGRGSGTQGGQLAIEMVRRRFEDIGLLPPSKTGSYLQTFPLRRWTQITPSFFEINGSALKEGVDYMYIMYSESASANGEPVFAGYGITVPAYSRSEYPKCPIDPSGYDDYENIDANGRAVIIFSGVPNSDTSISDNCPSNILNAKLSDRVYQGHNAALHGVKAIILLPNYRNTPGIIMYGYKTDSVGIPGTLEMDRDRMEAILPEIKSWAGNIDATLRPDSRLTGLSVEISATAMFDETEIQNVIGVIPGTDPRLMHEQIMFGAHIDHMGIRPDGDIYYGADDNASGVATVMELARLTMESGLKPARTLIFAAFNAEELGLIGSCYYAEQDPLYPLTDMKAMFSVDMVSVGDKYLTLFGATDPDKAWLAEVMAGSAKTMGLDATVVAGEPFLRSDHVCFVEAGIPAVMAFTQYLSDHPDYHTPRDTIDGISIQALKISSNLMWAALVPLATGEEGKYQDLKVPVTTNKSSGNKRLSSILENYSPAGR